jgi:hypothetical protein
MRECGFRFILWAFLTLLLFSVSEASEEKSHPEVILMD